MKVHKLLFALLLSACGSTAAKDGGPVVVIVDDDANSTPSNGSANGSTNGSTSNSNEPGGPRIVSLTASVDTVTPYEKPTFTVIIEDPDGLGDVAGGRLLTPEGASYGDFQPGESDGEYQLELSWTAINDVEDILFDGSTDRRFVAEFIDLAGNVAQTEISLTLTCADPSRESACEPGLCLETAANARHCGSCGNDISLAYNARCENGSPVCDDSSAVFCSEQSICAGYGVATACGSCSNNCELLADRAGITLGEENYVDCFDGACELSFNSRDRAPCSQQCGPLRCISASASYQDGGVSAGCDTAWEPTYGDYGSYVLTSCSCGN